MYYVACIYYSISGPYSRNIFPCPNVAKDVEKYKQSNRDKQAIFNSSGPSKLICFVRVIKITFITEAQHLDNTYK